MNKVHYKFGIGDKVRLTKRPTHFTGNCVHYSFNDDHPSTEYVIDGWGWVQTKEDEYEPFYRLHAYCDAYLQYHNRIAEDEIEAVGETHPFDDEELTVKSVNDDVIKIGMFAWDDIYYSSVDGPYISPSFTFTNYGEVFAITKFFDKYDKGGFQVSVHHQLRSRYDSATDKYILVLDNDSSSDIPGYLMTRITDTFAQEYVDQLFKDRNSKLLANENHCDYSRVRAWLEQMGIWDEVMRLYTKRKSGKSIKKSSKTTSKSTDKTNKNNKSKSELESMLAGLSAADKKKLKEMLK